MMSQTLSDYEDLAERLSVLQHHLMPSIAMPAVLASLDLAPDRADRIAGDGRAS